MSSELVTLEHATSPSHSPKFKRLTDRDKAFALRYSREGLTQTVIAQRLGVSQSAISLWLSQCEDTKAEAAQYLDGSALTIAQKAVKKGTATDLIKLLQGRGVVGEAQNGPNIIINIGGNDADVRLITAQVSTSCKTEHEPK